MGIILNDQGGRSQLQEKLAAELREKLAKSGSDEGEKRVENLQKSPDMVDESAYIKDYTKKSEKSENGRVVAIIVVGVAVLVLFGLILILTK